MDPDERARLEADFDRRMLQLYEDAAREKYFATAFLTMVHERRGLATAQHCLAAQTDGFTRLWEMGRLDLSVEFVVLQPRWRPLFTPAELDQARNRLTDAGAADLAARAEQMEMEP
ncbi:MAG: hypothetical protein WEC33_07780 [Dehalococcoidia bacterium]